MYSPPLFFLVFADSFDLLLTFAFDLMIFSLDLLSIFQPRPMVYILPSIYLFESESLRSYLSMTHPRDLFVHSSAPVVPFR